MRKTLSLSTTMAVIVTAPYPCSKYPFGQSPGDDRRRRRQKHRIRRLLQGSLLAGRMNGLHCTRSTTIRS